MKLGVTAIGHARHAACLHAWKPVVTNETALAVVVNRGHPEAMQWPFSVILLGYSEVWKLQLVAVAVVRPARDSA